MTTLTWNRPEMPTLLLRLLKWLLVPAFCLASFAFVYILSWQQDDAGSNLAAVARAKLVEIFGDFFVVELLIYRALTVLSITFVAMVLSGLFEQPARKMKAEDLTRRSMIMFAIITVVFLLASFFLPEILGLPPVETVVYCALVVICLESLWMHRRVSWLDGERVSRWQQRQQAKLVEPYQKKVKTLEHQLEDRERQIETRDHQIDALDQKVQYQDSQLENERQRSDLLTADLAAHRQETYDTCLAVRRGRRTFRIPVAQVRRLQSEGAELRVHLLDGSTHLGRGALRDVHQKLDPRQFIALSRSEVLRRDEIDYIERLPSGRRVVVTRQGERLDVPRSRWSDFEADLFDGARL